MPVEGECPQVVIARNEAGEAVLVDDPTTGTDFDRLLCVDPRPAQIRGVEERGSKSERNYCGHI